MFSNWFTLILLSALSLGVYDFSKKCALRANRVMPVLFLATLSGTLFLVSLNLCQGTFREYFSCTALQWWMIALKSLIVTCSWITGYFALHDLPLTLAAPIRASAPLWVTLGGMLLFAHIPTPLQLTGILLTVLGYVMFSAIGRKEGFSWRARGVRMIIASTLFGATSALYDNFLMQTMAIPADTVQLHFSIDLVWMLGTVWLLQPFLPMLREKDAFSWRWSIPAIGILLIAADWLFFHAIASPNSQIGILSLIRRLSVVISFFCAAIVFGEKHISRKLLALILILSGIIIIKYF